VIYVLTISNRFNDPDLWFHLKLGEIVWNTHSIPATDSLSHTASGHPWTAHEWLAQWGIYGVYRWGGYPGLMAGFAILGSLLLVLVYVLSYRRAGNALVAFLGGVSAWFFGTAGFAIRPQLAGYTFLAAELLVLDLALRNPRWLWVLPPMFAMWVNCHGSYLFGLGVLVMYWACSFLNRRWGLITAVRLDRQSMLLLTGILVLCAAALCLNPVGVRLLLYPLNVAFHQSTSLAGIDEWLPPSLGDSRGLGMLAVSAAILIIPTWRRFEFPLRDLLLVGMACALAIQHVRMLFVFGIAASPVLARMLAPLLGKDSGREHPVANAILMAGLVAATVSAYPGRAAIEQQIRHGNPAGAVEYIRQTGLTGPMLNEYVFGGYLIWALPEHKVFIDGRGDVFDWTGVLKEYGQWATLAEDPKILLEKYRIAWCVISQRSPLVQVMPYLPGWQRAYSDEIAVIFVRQNWAPSEQQPRGPAKSL
jgi:hypothetical protein